MQFILQLHLSFLCSTILSNACPNNCSCNRWADSWIDIKCQKTPFHEIISSLKPVDKNIIINTTNNKLIKSFAFNSTQWIISLVICAADLVDIQDYAFANLSALTSLQIHHSYHFTSLRENTLKGLHELIDLNIFRTSLSFISEKTFWNCSRLQLLQLGENKLTEIHENTVMYLPRLRFFTLSHNKISSISNKLLSNNHEIQTFGVEYNIISQIENNTFAHLRNLESLNLGNNRLKSVENVFENLTQLNQLILHHNEIQNLSKNTFANLHNLYYLSLKRNELREIREYDFVDLVELRFLILSDNNISYIDELAFQTLKSVWFIYLENNNIEVVKEQFFFKTTHIRGIWLQNNKIKFVHENAFVNLDVIRSLNLSSNQLTTLNASIFRRLNKLYRLNLSNNKITKLPPDIFKSLEEIHSLDLSQNQIINIGEILFENLVELRELDLAHNNITQVSETFFRSLSQLFNLRLNHNKLKCINKRHLLFLKDLIVLDLSQNLIHCTCHYLSALDALSSVKLLADCIDNKDQRINTDKITCKELQGTWHRKEFMKNYQSDNGVITFNKRILSNEILINFEFKLASYQRTKKKTNPDAIPICLTYRGNTYQQILKNFSFDNNWHSMEIYQKKKNASDYFSIVIDGCILHMENSSFNRQMISMNLSSIDSMQNESKVLFQNVSIFTKYLCDHRPKHNQIKSFNFQLLYPINFTNSKVIPHVFDGRFSIKMSRNISLCNGVKSNRIYVSPRGYITMNEKASFNRSSDIILAPFISNTTNCFSGNIYVEESLNLDTRRLVWKDTQTTSFPDHLLIITWINVTSTKNILTHNTFQLVIASNQESTVLIYRYADLDLPVGYVGLSGCNRIFRSVNNSFITNESSHVLQNTRKMFFLVENMDENMEPDNSTCKGLSCKESSLFKNTWGQLLLLIIGFGGAIVLAASIMSCGRQLGKTLRSRR